MDQVLTEAAVYERELMHMHKVATLAEDPVTALSAPVVTYNHDGIVLARIKDVPLMKIGMHYPASTGPVDFSFQHLSSAVSAGADPLVPRPRIKLGHTDPRYNESPCPSCHAMVTFDFNRSYTFDGDPGFGFVENTRLTNEGGQITADLVDVPLWLAKIMPVAFASRSIEGWFGYDDGPNQKEYDFVVTALALLGVCFPGVMDLADLPQMYGESMPDYVTVQEAA